MKNRPDMGLAGFEKGADYFLALQVGQVAQVVLPSAQHCIPHADFAADSFLQQVDEQPLRMTAATATTNKDVMIFMVSVLFVLSSAQARTTQSEAAADTPES